MRSQVAISSPNYDSTLRGWTSFRSRSRPLDEVDWVVGPTVWAAALARPEQPNLGWDPLNSPENYRLRYPPCPCPRLPRHH